jgi:hypothetical protein
MPVSAVAIVAKWPEFRPQNTKLGEKVWGGIYTRFKEKRA